MLLREYYNVPIDEWLLPPNRGVGGMGDCEEESIRQWLLNELLVTYGLPHDWLGNRMILVDSDSPNAPTKSFFGLAILTPTGLPFLWVSIKAPGYASEAERILREALLADAHAGMGIASDGSPMGTLVLRRRFDTDQCEVVNDVEPYESQTRVRTEPTYVAGFSESRTDRSSLRPLSERVENLFFEAQSHIRDIDGMHADEALDEVSKALYCKLHDEEMTPASQPYKMQRASYGCTEELAATVRGIYQQANDYDVRVFGLRIPGYKRSRGVFTSRIRLSSPALLKVVETFQSYDVGHSAVDVKGRAFQKMLNPAMRAGMGQFFTPEPVVKLMVSVVAPQVHDLILDPFCGSARFLTTSLQYVGADVKTTDAKLFSEFAFGKLHGIEKSDRMVRIAMTDMRLQGDGHSNIRCTDALLSFSNYPDLQPESFDVILTNPPFGSVLGAEAVTQLGSLSLAKGKRNVPLEVLGLERCVQFLVPGGRIGIVLPDGLLANRSAQYVRDWADRTMKIRAIVSLPIETFAPFGASVKTSILFARKWWPREDCASDYSVYLGRIDNIGYDAAGRKRVHSDIGTLTEQLKAFLMREGW